MGGIWAEPRAFFRLSPVQRSEAQSFGVCQGEIAERCDANYWRLTPLFHERFSQAGHPVRPLGDLSVLMQYGCSSLATEQPVGVPMLRMSNLQPDGWDLGALKYIQLDEAALERYRLAPGDLLFNRTNSKELVGKCDIFAEDGDWVFASYLIRVRLDTAKVMPQFVSDFLNTRAGRLQIDRLSRQIIGMTNVNAEELRSLLVPVPSDMAVQRSLVAAMDAARAERREKLNSATTLLEGVSSVLLASLGLPKPAHGGRKAYAVRLANARQGGRINAEYYHPQRLAMLRTMAQALPAAGCGKLAGCATFIRNQVRLPTGRYVGLAHVQSNTGELVPANEDATGACLLFQAGDVLFARLRPYLNKVYRAEADGCCSPEFLVLRVNDAAALRPDYLAAVLRSQATLAQTLHMTTGNTHPRLTEDDVGNLFLPLPADVSIQDAIVAEANRRRDEARRLRAEAEAGWHAAKQWFEDQLLGHAIP